MADHTAILILRQLFPSCNLETAEPRSGIDQNRENRVIVDSQASNLKAEA